MHLQVAEKASLAERRANALAGGLKLAFLSSHLTCCSTGEMEEARALLDSAERGKRQTEAELAESRAAVNEMNTINSKVRS